MKYLRLILIVFVLFIITKPAYAEKRIAVLPFEVPAERTDLKQYSIGTVDTISMALGTIPEFIMVDRSRLELILREQAFNQSGFVSHDQVPELGKLLGADILILGNIQAEKNKYRMSARLTEVSSSKILKIVQVTGESIFDLQDQLALAITSQQNIKLEDLQKQKINNITRATSNLSAYGLFTRAKTAYLSFSPEAFKKSIELYDEALREDPSYSLALASKAEAMAMLINELKRTGEPYQHLLKEAEEIALKTVKKDPELGEGHRALSIVYNTIGRYSEGMKEAKKAIGLNKNDAEAYVALWTNQSSINNLSSSEELIDKALSINPSLISALNARVSVFLKKYMNKEAVEVCEQLIKINPESAINYILLGNAYYNLDINKATEAYSRAIEINKNYSSAYSGLGISYLKKGDTENALINIRTALRINPESDKNMYFLAMVYSEMGKLKEAAETLNDSIRINPERSELYSALASVYLKTGELEKAKQNYLIVIDKSNGKDLHARTELAIIYKMTDELAKAETELESILVLKENYIYAMINLADVYYLNNKPEQSLETLNKIFEKNKEIKAAFPYFLRAEIMMKKADYQAALPDYQKAEELSSGKPVYYESLATCYFMLKDYENAIIYYQKALKNNPENYEIHNKLGAAFFSSGKNKEAINSYKEAIRIKPELAMAFYNLAISYETENNKDEAIRAYKKACNLGMNEGCNISLK